MITRIGIGAAHLVNLDETVSGDHARIMRVELPADLVLTAILVKPVDPVGDDEERAMVSLGDEVPKWKADRPGKAHGLAVTRGDGEVAVG